MVVQKSFSPVVFFFFKNISDIIFCLFYVDFYPFVRWLKISRPLLITQQPEKSKL